MFNRTQFVKFWDVLSQGESVKCGVPQGSIIGPLLFILFYNDFPSCLKHSEVIIYADDTVIFVPGKDVTIIETRLSADMKRINEWCLKNELILNPGKGKTESILFGTSRNLAKQPSDLKIKYAHENVQFTKTYKYLGVKITPSLNINTNFDHMYLQESQWKTKIITENTFASYVWFVWIAVSINDNSDPDLLRHCSPEEITRSTRET